MTDTVHPLRAYRKAQSPPVTLADLAVRTGISKATLSRIETGDLPLTLDTARRISAVTDIPMRELLPDVAKEFAANEAAE